MMTHVTTLIGLMNVKIKIIIIVHSSRLMPHNIDQKLNT